MISHLMNRISIHSPRRTTGSANSISSVIRCCGSYTTKSTRRPSSPYLVMSSAMSRVIGRMSDFFRTYFALFALNVDEHCYNLILFFSW